MSGVRILSLKAEHYDTPLGIESPAPRLSWQFEGDAEDWSQRSYQITVQRANTSREDYHITSAQSVLVPWPSQPLLSRERARVGVRSEGVDGGWTEWSTINIETGLLKRSDWSTTFVTGESQPADSPKRPFRLRQTFNVASLGEARLYITALGLYEAYLNGKRVGDDLFGPGWTSYYARLPYQTYDVTPLLRAGTNVLGAWVGEGWYAGRLGYQGGTRNIYGDRIGLLAQMEVDGIAIQSDGWEWSYGSLISSEIYNGEVFDTRLPNTDFDAENQWSPAESLDLPDARLFSSQSPPVRIVDTIRPQELITSPSGKIIADFGQNFAGVVQILADPQTTASEIVIRHAEVLELGELGVRPLRYAAATERIILGGSSIKGYMPKFTFHGFRYAEITGWDDIALDDIQGVVIQSSMSKFGDFSCSHELINRLHDNCVWSTMANTISVPTDCPQRDERLGWTGDICVFAPTMSYLFDTAGFLGEWLGDLYHDQKRLDGVVPIFCPDTATDHSYPEAIWGDAAVLTPYDLFEAYGDPGILERQFDSIQLWLAKGVRRNEHGLWARDQDQLGDWLAPKASPETPNMGPTDNHLVADAWLIHSTKTAGKIARAIGRVSAAREYEAQSLSLVKAFYHEYVTPSGRLVSETQTALCLLLHYDIIPPVRTKDPDYRTGFSNRLAHLVRSANWLVDTGFAGTPLILQTLAETQSLDHAYRMLQSKNCPSWLACVLLGATSIWERWDSMLSDGTINPGEMTSFNHYALGSVASFMHQVIGGLSPVSPGWKEVVIRPQPGGTVTSAKTSHLGPYGRISVEWEIKSNRLDVIIEVPPNSTARVILPNGFVELVGSGKREYSVEYKLPPFPPPAYIPHFAPVRSNEWI